MPSKYAATIDLSRLNDAHTLSILATPRGTDVLDVGAADGSVARVLRERGCRVWAIEADPEAARDAMPCCERITVADVETMDLEHEFAGQSFDTVLLLDVLEHLKAPEPTLRRLASLLKPNGLVVASIPNVTHADVRLTLLRGSFTYTDTGLLDRTHLRLFDRKAVETLFHCAGLLVTQILRVVVPPGASELAVDLSSYPPEVIAEATHDTDSDTYQFVVVASPHASPDGVSTEFQLITQLQSQFQELEETNRQSTAYARSLVEEIERLRASITERDDQLYTINQKYSDIHSSTEEYTVEVSQLREDVQILKRALNIKDEYVTQLREQLDESLATQRKQDEYIAHLHRVIDSQRTRVKSGVKTVVRSIPPLYWLARKVRRRTPTPS